MCRTVTRYRTPENPAATGPCLPINNPEVWIVQGDATVYTSEANIVTFRLAGCSRRQTTAWAACRTGSRWTSTTGPVWCLRRRTRWSSGCRRTSVPARSSGRVLCACRWLRVLQLLTAGVENVRSFVPTGVVLRNARGGADASTAELAVAFDAGVSAWVAGLRPGSGGGALGTRRAPGPGRSHRPAPGVRLIGQALERRLDGFEARVPSRCAERREGVAGMDALPICSRRLTSWSCCCR